MKICRYINNTVTNSIKKKSTFLKYTLQATPKRIYVTMVHGFCATTANVKIYVYTALNMVLPD